MRLLLFLLLASCGVSTLAPDPETAPDPQGVILAVWGAPWCSVCKRVLPDIQKELDRVGSEKITFRLYVPTGNSSGSRPNQSTTDSYRDYLKLKAEAVNDDRWSVFKQTIGSGLALPAGAVFTQEMQVIEVFPPGSLDAGDIVDAARKAL